MRVNWRSLWRRFSEGAGQGPTCASMVLMGSLFLGDGYQPAAIGGDDPLENLQQRVAILEEENRTLRSEIESEKSVEPNKEATAAEDRINTAPIGPLVEKYLNERPRDVDPIDEFQEQRIASLQESLTGITNKLNKKSLPSVQVNGVFQTDMGFFQQDANSHATYGNIQDGADFRRTRLSAKGSLSDTTHYMVQMDFAFFGRPTFTDVWGEQTEIPGLGNVRVGQWKQPFSLEVVSSFRYTTFAERSLLFQAFTPFRHLGAGFYNTNDDQTMTWAASGFTTGQDQFGGSISNSGGWGTAERITFLPFWDDSTQGDGYLHLGLGHFLNVPPNHIANFRTIPELYVGQNGAGVIGSSGQAAPGGFNGTPFISQTGNLGINHYNVLGTEFLWVDGPLSIQSEGMVNLVDQSAGVLNGATPTVNFANGNSTAMLAGGYAQVGYFLTGEHRPYDRKAGAVDRIQPRHSFAPWNHDRVSGWGAWEIAGRWSYLDLNDKTIRGGTVTDLTAGLNWYLNAYWKMQFNYIHSMPRYTPQSGPAGTPDSPFAKSTLDMFDFRCQIDF
ncbi:MAG: hypothetical protein DWH91_12590 [Planctomycetota bacterium]|nr:MAG: hypothetical protein DWH91_12590 [Planctomycetota bacterium]